MSDLLLITSVLEPSAEVLPALGLLLHPVRVLPADASALVEAPPADAVLMDARRDLAHAKSICRLLQTTGLDCPLFAIVTEGGLAAVNAEWGVDDVILHTAGPAEVEARVRLAIGRRAIAAVADAPDEIRSGELAIDEATYAARLRGRVLDLTFKEFELLKFLAQHPGRVFTRAQLLQEVWGYDYFGGTRTVDVHVRRLRAKLGPEHEALIGTVRNVGYRFVPVKGERPERSQGADRAQRRRRQKDGQATSAPGPSKTWEPAPRPRLDDPKADHQRCPQHRTGRRRPGPGPGRGPDRRRGAAVRARDAASALRQLRPSPAEPGFSTGRDFVLTAGGGIAGYAYLDPLPPDPESDVSGELVIHPDRRRQGLGRALVGELAAAAGGHTLRLWAHGDLPAAAGLARVTGFERFRALWQMRRPLRGPLDRPVLPAGRTLRAFVPGQDEDEWLSLNGRAFAKHPEQGGWSRHDLELREREPWFDPAGFFIAETAGHMAGFHWTKVHPPGEQDSHRRASGRSTWWESIPPSRAAGSAGR